MNVSGMNVKKAWDIKVLPQQTVHRKKVKTSSTLAAHTPMHTYNYREYRGSALDYWSTARAIDPAPGA